MERHSKTHRSPTTSSSSSSGTTGSSSSTSGSTNSSSSSSSSSGREREERERVRREREDRKRHERERSDSERHRRERERSDRERRERGERERSGSKRHERERSGREIKERSVRERHGREERERGGHERREREESGRKRRHQSEEKRETSKRQRRETEEQYGHRLPQPSSQSSGSHRQQPTSSSSRPIPTPTATHIPTRPVEEYQEYSETTHYTTSQPPTMMNIPRFVPPFSGQMYPAIPPPQYQSYPGYHYPPQYSMPPPPYGGSFASQQQYPQPFIPRSHPPPYGSWFDPQQQYSQTAIQPSHPPPNYPPMFRPMPPPSHSQPLLQQQRKSVGLMGPQQSGTAAQPSSTTFSLIPISKEENWLNERSVSRDVMNVIPFESGILGKAVYQKLVSKGQTPYWFFRVNYGVKVFCVEDKYDRIHWYLYMDRILHVRQEMDDYVHNLRECGQHVLVSQRLMLMTIYTSEDANTKKRKRAKPMPINSVIPFCRNGSVCYGMQCVDKPNEGLRWWWFIAQPDRNSGFYEMYDSTPYQRRLQFFNHNARLTGLLLHFEAKLLLKDPTQVRVGGIPTFCITLYMGGTFIMFDKTFNIFIENEQKLVTLQELVDCGAIDGSVTKHSNTLLMLEEIESQTASSVWCVYKDYLEGQLEYSAPKMFLRIPDRNAITYMWFWNSDHFNSGLQYVQWYQSTRDWIRRFEFETQSQFTQPFAGTDKPEIEPTKLWLANDPRNRYFVAKSGAK